MENHPKLILLVSSSGGVLLDLMALEPWWSQYHVVWAVVRATDTTSALTGQHVHWIQESTLIRPAGIVSNLVSAWRILHCDRPDLIVSAGSAPAIAFFLVARLLSIPTFWISTFNVLAEPGISARICARLAKRVLLQRRSLLSAHPDGFVIGELY